VIPRAGTPATTLRGAAQRHFVDQQGRNQTLSCARPRGSPAAPARLPAASAASGPARTNASSDIYCSNGFGHLDMFGWGWLNEMTNVQGKRSRHSDGDSKRNPSVPNYNATAAAVRHPSTRKFLHSMAMATNTSSTHPQTVHVLTGICYRNHNAILRPASHSSIPRGKSFASRMVCHFTLTRFSMR
jgi:hypothetical protein